MERNALMYAYWDHLDKIWNNMCPFLDNIYDQGVSIKDIEPIKFHTYLYRYCTTFFPKATGSPQDSGNHLYVILTNYLNLRLKEIAAEIEPITTNENLLIIYAQKWLPYQKASAKLNHMCHYFNENWVKREQQQGNSEVVEIYQLAMNRWMELVFRPYDTFLLDAIRQNKQSKALVYQVLQSIVQLYANDVNQQTTVRDKLINVFGEESGILQLYETWTMDSFKSILETKSYADFKPFLKYACLVMPDIVEGNEFKAFLKSHIVPQLVDEMAKSMEGKINGKDYVQAILGLRYGILERGLRDHNKLLCVIDEVCCEAINSSEINKKMTAAELLAKYSHQLMTKKHTPEEDLKAELQRIVKVLDYLHDKDIFVNIYRFFLQHRQINEKSTSDDMETWMISQIAKRFGYDLITELSKQLTDMHISNAKKTDFDSYLGRRNIKLGFDFRLKYFSENKFPSNINLILPMELQEVFKLFEEFIVTDLSDGKKKLKLNIKHSSGEIIININQRTPNIVQVNMFEMALLLQFNQNNKYTVKELAVRLGTEVDTIIPGLNNLIKLKVLLCGESLIWSSTVEVAKDFTSRKRHLTIDRAGHEKKIQKIESTDDIVLRERRKNLVKCAVVRIMKNKKQMTHGQLMSEVIGALQNQFKPDTKLVKTEIENLIELKYIARPDPNLYLYLS